MGSENDQTLEGSFSSVSKPIFATKYSFSSIFQDLPYLHTFAPVQIKNIRKIWSNVFVVLLDFLQNITTFRQFSSNFALILITFSFFPPAYSFEENSRKDQDCLAEEGTPENENAHVYEKNNENTETTTKSSD